MTHETARVSVITHPPQDSPSSPSGGEGGFFLRDILLACRRPRVPRHGGPAPRIKSAIINRLRTAAGAVVSTKALIASIYGDDPNGGPTCADDCIAVFILRLRAEGWPIETVGYQGYRYRYSEHEVTA